MKKLANVIIISFILTLTWAFAPIQNRSYAQTDNATPEDDLLANTLSRIKRVAIGNRLQEIVVWKIEADEGVRVDVKSLSTKLSFALMDEDLLTEQAIDLTEIEDREELRRLASIYELGALVYGKRTVVDGETIKVSFQILDARNDALIWEGVISSEKPLPPELLLALSYAKWVSLVTGVGTGIGAGTTLFLAFDTSINKQPLARSDSEADQIFNEVIFYQDWSIGLGIASLVSSGIATYLFLIDQENSSQGVASLGPIEGGNTSILLWPQPGGVTASVYLRF